MKNFLKAGLINLETKNKYQRLVNEDSGTCGIKSGHVILKPGERIGKHTTENREEMVIVLKGRGEAKIAQENTLKIKKNTVLYVPPQTIHDIKNTGSKVLEYIFITSPINHYR